MPTESDQAVITRFVTQLKQRYQALESRDSATSLNRRQTLRRPCGVMLDVAFSDNAEIRDGVYHTVRCRDLSSTGFSFLTQTRPPVGEFIVRFRMEHDEILVKTRVIHVTPTMAGATTEYVIGCLFTERFDNRKPVPSLETAGR